MRPASFYDLKEVTKTRLVGRDTHLITVTPKDEYRYGYRLWIDETTAMPLKTQLCDSRGRVIEQVVFASLTLSSIFPMRRSSLKSLLRGSSGCAAAMTTHRRRIREPSTPSCGTR